eukprot:2024431-Heterocapsa_arctica.AAC.1
MGMSSWAKWTAASLRGTSALSQDLPEFGLSNEASRGPVVVHNHPIGFRYMQIDGIATSWGLASAG